MTVSNPTIIEWYTLPKNGNGGAACVYLRLSTCDSSKLDRAGYLLGWNRQPRYPMPCLIGEQSISSHGVVLFVADEKKDAIVKWWKQEGTNK